MSDAITLAEAKRLAETPEELGIEGLNLCWKEIARAISYHHADDSCREWGLVAHLRPSLDALEAEFDRRGIERPSRKGFLL